MTRAAALLGCIGLFVGASTGARAQALSGEELRRELAGNTLTGYNTSGVVFSEYHSPDGRILGHNNGEPVLEGCWDVRREAVCYYYARSRHAGTYCWRYERLGADGYRIESLESQARGIARLDPGNPRGHSDHGRPWVCEGLVSGLDSRNASMAEATDRSPATSGRRLSSGSTDAFDGHWLR